MEKVKIVAKPGVQIPEYATAQSAGVDLRAHLDTDCVILGPYERKLIPTGLFMQIPEGYEGQVRPRSGLALKKGITVLNAPGTIDSDYRGEIGVILINLDFNQSHEIKNGERIAQMVFAKCEQAMFEKVNSLDETERGEGGFGSTGTK